MPTAVKDNSPSRGPVRLPKRKLPPLVDIALPAVAVASGAMLFMAVPNIVGGSDLWAWLKAGTLALSATVVSFVVNRQAIERGAPLATTGYIGAGLLSIASIVGVGAGLFATTYSGLVFKDVAETRLVEHGAAISEFVADRSAAAAQAGRVSPAVQPIVDDLQEKAVCEVERACVSGRGGGRGPVARMIEERAGRAAAIGRQLATSEKARLAIIGRLNEHLAKYQGVLGDTAIEIWERRSQLQLIDAQIRQDASTLDEVVPVSLLSAFASELQGGVAIPRLPEAEANLNGILSRHGATLASVIAGIDKLRSTAPAFPKRTGVADTLDYLGHFLPVAAIAAVVELVLPLVLWLYTFWSLRWDSYREEEAARRGPDNPEPPPRLLDLPAGKLASRSDGQAPSDQPETQNGELFIRHRRRGRRSARLN
jgi:hypothetical protein